MRPLTYAFLFSYIVIFSVCFFYLFNSYNSSNYSKNEYNQLLDQLKEIIEFRDSYLKNIEEQQKNLRFIQSPREEVKEEEIPILKQKDEELFDEVLTEESIASAPEILPELTEYEANLRGLETALPDLIYENVENLPEIPNNKVQNTATTTPTKTSTLLPRTSKTTIKTSPIGPKFVPFQIAKNSALETITCVNATYQCLDYPESSTDWPDVPYETYQQIIGNKLRYTSPDKSEFKIINECSENSNKIEILIISKNALSEPKNYGGDFWLGRMTLAEFSNYTKYGMADDSYDTYFPPEKYIDHKNGSYSITFDCNHEKMEETLNYQVQIFLIRHSESISATIKAMAGLNPKSRVFRGTVGTEKVGKCGPLLPEKILDDAPVKDNFCVINDVPGREWVCQKPSSGNCGNLTWLGFDSRDWNMGDKLKNFQLDEVYEDLAFSHDFKIIKSSIETATTTKTKETATITNAINPNGYWYKKKWYTPNLEPHHLKVSKRTMLKNKIFIILGDSLSAQFMTEFKSNIEKYQRDVLRLGKGKFKCEKQEYGFLGIIKGEKCPANPGPWAPNIFTCKGTNTTFVRLPHGMPIHKDGCVETAQYTGDMLEQMVKNGWIGPEYILLMTHGAHFAAFNPIVFYRRLIDIKKSVEKYRKSSPDSLIIFKTLNYIRGDFSKLWSTVSSFNAYRQREMAFKIFGNPYENDMRNNNDFPVKVLDVWPMTKLAFDHMEVGNVHPGWGSSPQWMLDGIINYFIDYIHYLGYL